MHKTDQSEQLCLKVEEGVALTSTSLPQITSGNQAALWIYLRIIYTLERPLNLKS